MTPAQRLLATTLAVAATAAQAEANLNVGADAESDSGSFASANGYQYLGIPAAVPEPQTDALMAAGLCAVGFVARRRRLG